MYNNLQFTNLANYDPTTYFLLLQLRVVVTGVVFQVKYRQSAIIHEKAALAKHVKSVFNDYQHG